jgi:hypothetical protein
VGVGKAKKGAQFIVCAKADQRYGVKLFKSERWAVQTGAKVSPQANRAIVPGVRRIVVGHGDPEALWLVCGDRARSRRWLWVGMEDPPEKARLYLYSCWSGQQLAGFLDGNFVFGHYGAVPTPRHENRMVVMPFLRKVFEIMDTGKHARPRVVRPLLKRVAAALVKVHYADSDGRALIAAVLLAKSLYRAGHA